MKVYLHASTLHDDALRSRWRSGQDMLTLDNVKGSSFWLSWDMKAVARHLK